MTQIINDNHYFGKYRGFVKDNKDPKHQGRLILLVPPLLGNTQTHWALPCMPYGGSPDTGWFALPEIDAQVWVEFEEGCIDSPIWTGTFWQQSDESPRETQESLPDVRMLKTASGHTLLFDDSENNPSIRLFHKDGAELNIDKEGSIFLLDGADGEITMNAEAKKLEIKDANGNTLTMSKQGTEVRDTHGNKIVMQGSGITVSATTLKLEGAQVQVGGAGGEPLIKGTSFLSLFATHVHTCSGSGFPSSPPIPQGEFSTLSVKNTVT